MALLFICDNCGKEYKAKIALNGPIRVEGQTIKRETDPCPECVADAEKATQEALAKRKKKE